MAGILAGAEAVNITLIREKFYKDRTIGRLWFGTFYVWTLEDVVREVEGEPVEEWKRYGETAIPCGTYKLILDWSNRFQKEMPHILDVPGFSGVRIHSGNGPEHTEGCILVGTSVSQGRLVDSRSAYNLVMDMLDNYYESGKTVDISITGLPPNGIFDLPKVA